MTKEAQRAEGTVESEQEEVANTQPTLLGAVLEEMGAPAKEEPKTEEVPTPQEEEQVPNPEVIPPAEGVDVPESEEPQSEETEEVAEEPAAEEEPHAREEWPEDAKARITAESEKRRKRTAERDKAVAERNQAIALAQQYQAQAQQAYVQLQQKKLTPTERDPLADVQDIQQLENARRQADELEAFAERCLADPEKAQNVLLGATATGEEVRESYTPQQLVDMKLQAKRIKERIPVKYTLFQRQAAANAEALKLYPKLQTDPVWNQRANVLLQQIPELRSQPDYLIWIGHALHGEEMIRTKAGTTQPTNGQNGLSKVAEQLKNQVKFKPAPGIVKSRSPVAEDATSKSKIEALKKKMKENPTDANREAFIAATILGGSPKNEAALV